MRELATRASTIHRFCLGRRRAMGSRGASSCTRRSSASSSIGARCRDERLALSSAARAAAGRLWWGARRASDAELRGRRLARFEAGRSHRAWGGSVREGRGLLEADFSIGNLECPVATTGAAVEKMYTFRAAPSVLPRLREHFDAVSVANNHSGDYGPAAFDETLARLRATGLPYFGGGRDSSEAHASLMLKRRGITIALLGYDDVHPRSFEASPDRAGVAWAEEEQIVLDIARARAAGADVMLPFMHWAGKTTAPRVTDSASCRAR